MTTEWLFKGPHGDVLYRENYETCGRDILIDGVLWKSLTYRELYDFSAAIKQKLTGIINTDPNYRPEITPKEFYDYVFLDKNVGTEAALKQHDADKREIEADYEEVSDD